MVRLMKLLWGIFVDDLELKGIRVRSEGKASI
jgi:hypothetical protein